MSFSYKLIYNILIYLSVYIGVSVTNYTTLSLNVSKFKLVT